MTMASQQQQHASLCLTALPDELIAMCYSSLSANDLISLECVSSRLRSLIASDTLCWKDCVFSRWGNFCPSLPVLGAASFYAGSWKSLYAEKAESHKRHAPWLMACDSEINAMVDIILQTTATKDRTTEGDSKKPTNHSICNSTSNEVRNPWLSSTSASMTMTMTDSPTDSVSTVAESPPRELWNFNSTSPRSVILPSSTSVEDTTSSSSTSPARNTSTSIVLLFDASSSVTDEDFKTMKAFTKHLITRLCPPSASSEDEEPSKCSGFVALIQFNQHPRVELQLTPGTKPKVLRAVDAMTQLMGSTDIAAPIRRARELLADAPRQSRKVICLMTDGQTHADELRESERETQRVATEMSATMYTIGVGRDIDEKGLNRIASATEKGMYFTLRRFVHSK